MAERNTITRTPRAPYDDRGRIARQLSANELVAIEDLSTTPDTAEAVHHYHLGTPQVVTAPTTNIVWRANYLPFGQPLETVTSTHNGNKTGAIRKTPLMRVKDGDAYVLVASQGGAPTNPVWVHNLRVDPRVEIRDETNVQNMRVREVDDEQERARLWALSVRAFPPYEEYQARTTRKIPVFIAEPENA